MQNNSGSDLALNFEERKINFTHFAFLFCISLLSFFTPFHHGFSIPAIITKAMPFFFAHRHATINQHVSEEQYAMRVIKQFSEEEKGSKFCTEGK